MKRTVLFLLDCIILIKSDCSMVKSRDLTVYYLMILINYSTELQFILYKRKLAILSKLINFSTEFE